jgi:peptide/nickel transport system ATP-binding protein/oligopeptide transport system ATP-binding protein
MYAGKIMEAADAETLFGDPQHPYTVGLMSSIPVLGIGKKQRRLSTIPGVVPSLFRLPEGCLYNDRCSEPMKACGHSEPPLIDLGNGHIVRCHKYA